MQKRLVTLFFALAIFPGCRAPAEDSFYEPEPVEFEPGLDSVTSPGSACPAETPDLFNNTLSPIFGGDEEVRLEITTFSYFGCPLCADLAQVASELWEENEDYRKYVRFHFRHFVLSGETGWQLHKQSVAAYNQGEDHFWALHDYIYDDVRAGKYPSPSDVEDFAKDTLKLDMATFESDSQSDETLGLLQWDKSQGADQGISGTPAVFLCGERIPNSVTLDKAAFTEQIDNLLYP